MEAIRRIISYMAGITYEQFLEDSKTQDAVIRNLQVIGEAAKKLSQTLCKAHPHLPWKQMAGMRDKLIHAYFGADSETIYKAAKTNIPQLKMPIQKMLIEQEKQ